MIYFLLGSLLMLNVGAFCQWCGGWAALTSIPDEISISSNFFSSFFITSLRMIFINNVGGRALLAVSQLICIRSNVDNRSDWYREKPLTSLEACVDIQQIYSSHIFRFCFSFQFMINFMTRSVSASQISEKKTTTAKKRFLIHSTLVETSSINVSPFGR